MIEQDIGREVYPNAPVVFVALEIRHPSADPLSAGERTAIKRSLAKHLPVLRMAQQMVIAGQIGSVEPPQVQQEVFPKLFNRAQTIGASLRNDSIVLETTSYRHFEQFRDLAALVIGERHRIAPIDGIERVGLRYIDEIRVPYEAEKPDWSEWVDPRLIGSEEVARELGYVSKDSQGLLAMEVAPQQNLVLRFGPREGFAVDPNGDLRRPATSPGKFFLCDIDSFWMPDGETPEFSADSVVAICNDLHSPIRHVFESVITERLRDEVLRNG